MHRRVTHGLRLLQKRGLSPRIRPPSASMVGSTYTSDPDDHLLHPSFMNDTSVQQPIHISRNQRDDIPLKILNVNCQSVVRKKASLLNMCETTGADIVIGTESWLSDQHLSTEIFPDEYKVFRRDRKKHKGGGVFILVRNHLQCMEPEELRIDHDCEMTWVQIKVTGASSLYVRVWMGGLVFTIH